MTRLKEHVAVAECQLGDIQSTLLTVEGECDEYCLYLCVEEQQRSGMEA